MKYKFDKKRLDLMLWVPPGHILGESSLRERSSYISCRRVAYGSKDITSISRMFFWSRSHQGSSFWSAIIRGERNDIPLDYIWEYLFAKDEYDYTENRITKEEG